MKRKFNISLKYKLLLLLVSLSVFVLIAFATLAVNDFEKDKIAYVFDSTLSHSQSTANLLRSELQSSIERTQFLMRGFDSSKTIYHQYSKSIFATDKSISLLYAFTSPTENQKFTSKNSLIKESFSPELQTELSQNVKKLYSEAIKNRVSIHAFKADPTKWALALRFNFRETGKQVVAIAVQNNGTFLESFAGQSTQDAYLATSAGDVIISPMHVTYSEIKKEVVHNAIRNTLQKIQNDRGIQEYTLPNKEDALLVSMASSGVGGLKVFSIIPKSTALEAVKVLKYKALLFFIFLVSATIIIAVLTSNRMTSTLNKLITATKQISNGDYNISLNFKAKDEFGQLADNFNVMAEEIGRLLLETAEKSRMEGELKTAKLVQETLFPEPSFKRDNIEIEGFYEPASECGGDWWFHSHVNGKSYLWIGDATGHGAPAALVTAAARSAASVIDNLGDLPPEQIMTWLNKCIYNTAKGQVLMTFFLGVYDPVTNILTYCNASHDPPYLLPTSQEPLKKKDIIPLIDHTFPRLGEAPETEYRSSEQQLSPGDRIVFYTDGVPELKNPQDEMLGERNFLRTILKTTNDKDDLKTSIRIIADQIENHREGQPLEDDVTYFLVQV